MNISRSFLIISCLLVAFLCAAGCTGSDDKSGSGTATGMTGSTAATGNDGNIAVEISEMDVVMPGIYVQFPQQGITFIDFTLTNNGDTDATVSVESEISGYTEKAINMEVVPAHKTITIGQTPLFRQGQQMPSERTNAQLHYTVKSGGNVILEQTDPVTIYAKDTMVWSIDEGDDPVDMSRFIGAWVTPHATGMDKLIRTAANYHSDRSITGYQCGESCENEDQWEEYTNEQVKAIYSALQKDYAITYINTPISFGRSSDSTQKVRLPADSLAAASANCIDGTVLYASALEAMEINPHIIVTPSHAFVCYDTSDNEYSMEVCLETTMTGSSPFEDAVAQGNEEYAEEQANGNFKSGASQDLSVADLRAKGILPFN